MWSTSNYVWGRCKDEDEIVIYAYTNAGKQIYRDLLQLGIRRDCIKCFVDNNPEKIGQVYNGIKVISVVQLLSQHPNAVVVNAGQKAQEEITKMLLQQGIGEDKIVKYIVTWEDIAYAPESEYANFLMQLYEHHFDAKLDLVHPVKFSEKIQWIKLYDNSPLKTKLADKYLVRDWIKEKIGEQYLIPLLGTWERPEEIDYDGLPGQFVLKCNHGSDYVSIVKDKKQMDKHKINQLLREWLDTEFAYKSLELHYRGIPRKILAEQYIQQQDGGLTDYKFHCFGGKPRAVQLVGNRDFREHTAKEIFMDLSWNPMPCTYTNARYEEGELEKPSTFDEMIHIAEILSEGFRYVRVDLYSIEGQILFGEMTFTPTSGYSIWKPAEYDQYWGQFIEIK